MKVTDFINKLKHIASLSTTYYSVAGGNWAKWNGKSWNFDCVILIKAILWGWNENKNHAHGGANYGSNGVYDDSADGIINRCKNVSSNFKSIQVGELLYMPGHVGIYIGNGQVIECTAAWESKVLYSKIGPNGERSRNGVNCGRWQKHGKLPYIEYEAIFSNNTTQTTKSITDLANEVIVGKYGVGEARKKALGSLYNEVQTKVNEILNKKNTTNKKSNETIANEVIQGKWGNGQDRKNRLTKAGYNYNNIQAIVDKKLLK